MPPDSRFCPYCGSPVPDTSDAPSSASTISTIAAVLPKVLILTDPSVASPWGPNYTVFKSVATDLGLRSVPLVNPTFNQGLHWTAYQNAKTGTPKDAASKLGLTYQAALVVTFSCKTLKMGFGGDLDEPYTSRATVSGYVLEAASGKAVKRMIIVHRLGAGRDDEEAEKDAVLQAAKAFARDAFIKVNEWACGRELQGDPFLVRFLGIGDYGQAAALRSVIGSIPRCSDVMQKGVSIGDPKVRNFSEITLRYRGAVEQLRRAVARALSSNLDRWVVDVSSKSGHLIEVRLSRPLEGNELESIDPQPEWATSSLTQHASTATIGVKRIP